MLQAGGVHDHPSADLSTGRILRLLAIQCFLYFSRVLQEELVVSKLVEHGPRTMKVRAGILVFIVIGMSLIGCGQQDDSVGRGQGGSSAFETEDGKKKSGAFKMRGINATGF